MFTLQHVPHHINLHRLVRLHVIGELEHRFVLCRPIGLEQHVDHVDRPLVMPNHPLEEQTIELCAARAIERGHLFVRQHPGHEHLVLHPVHLHLVFRRRRVGHRQAAFRHPLLHQRDLIALPDDVALAEDRDVLPRAVRSAPAGHHDRLRVVRDHPGHEINVGVGIGISAQGRRGLVQCGFRRARTGSGKRGNAQACGNRSPWGSNHPSSSSGSTAPGLTVFVRDAHTSRPASYAISPALWGVARPVVWSIRVPDSGEIISVAGHDVAISNPRKVLFPQAGHTKLDLVRYYLAVSEGALRGAGDRPNVLVRYPNGIGGEFFYQKRAPSSRPEWIDVVSLSFPSGRTAEEVVPRSAAALAWMANLACLELHPHPVRAEDLDHPDELRVDLDPVPGVQWDQVREVARVVRAALDDFGLTGWPKTSGSRGIHVYVRIEARWTFDEVRRAALAFAREVERRAPTLATSKWWKEERHGVFLDYNQNAKDRTIAGAFSGRPTADARVSAPLAWNEIDTCDPREFTLKTMPARVRSMPNPHAAMNDRPCRLEALLELAERDAREGLGAAPWPPHYRKQEGEPARVQPSRRRTSKHPLIEIARSGKKANALAGVERWKARHPDAAAHLQAADVLVDAMRGRFHTWTRIRINLQHVPEDLRPPQEPLDPDETPDDWANVSGERPRRTPSRARKGS